MIITIASGKGGTGKTTVAANLAYSIARFTKRVTWLVDCDVEEPNAALFLRPELTEKQRVERLLPQIDPLKCTGCGVCAKVCENHALAVVNGRVLFFKELCHACGSCALSCPEGAIQEVPELVGMLEKGQSEEIHFAQGTLEIGYSSPTPVIRALKKWAVDPASESIFILDASPGTSCPVVETMRGSDFALFVTEPTPFGLHDLELVAALNEKEFHLPAGIVINKSGINDGLIEHFAAVKGIPILMRIPLSRAFAEAYAEGKLLADVQPELRSNFLSLFDSIESMLKEKGGVQ